MPEGLGQELNLSKAYFWIYKMTMNIVPISQNGGMTRRDGNVMSGPWLGQGQVLDSQEEGFSSWSAGERPAARIRPALKFCFPV